MSIQMPTKLLILMLIPWIVGCHVGRPQPEQVRSVWFSAAETTRYLAVLGHCGLSNTLAVQDTWDVSVNDVERAHRKIITGLGLALDSTDLRGRQQEYILQYFGVVIRGRRVLLVNGVHEMVVRSMSSDRWRTEPVSSCDVGPAAFQVNVDVITGEVGAFRIDQGWSTGR
jgi:hypothetical protein